MNNSSFRLCKRIVRGGPWGRFQRLFNGFLAVVFLALGGWLLSSVGATAADSPEYVPDELIVAFKAALTQDQQDEVEQTHGDQHVQLLPGIKARLLKISSRRPLLQAFDGYQADPSVLYVQPNYIYHAVETIPNDTYFGLQYAMKNTGQVVNGTSGLAGADIEATFAWDRTRGSRNVVVGVVDTGVDYTHPDLSANIWSNPGNLGLGNAGTHGYNAITGSYDPMDDNGHGTHVSGTVGATGNNATGVVGVNWVTSIMGLKFLDSTGSGTTANAVSAIDYAVHAKVAGVNVRVLNASWGGGGPDPALLNEITLAGANDILFVAAAGNGDAAGRPINIDINPFYPASYSLSAANMIVVAATDSRDQIASFSNYGVQTVQLGAPGVNIASTWPGNQYYYASGTSMATPHVTGSAALVLSAQPALSTAQVKAAILNNVDPISSLSGKTATGGRLNVNRAIPSTAPDFSISMSPSSSTVTAGGSTTYTVTVTPSGGFSGSVSFSVSGLPSGATGSFNLTSVTGSGSTTLTVTTTTGTLSGSSTLTVTGTSGSSTHTATATLVVNPVQPTPDFSISVSPASSSVKRGNSTAYTITVTSLSGFSGQVSLSVSGLPSRTSASFNPNPVSVSSGTSGTSTMTVTTSGRTTPTTRTLTIRGTSGALTHSTTATLIVTF